MATIVNLEDYRKPRKPAAGAPGRFEGVPHYYCQRCDTDHFKLFATGEIHCAHCGALMRNINVNGSPSRGTGH